MGHYSFKKDLEKSKQTEQEALVALENNSDVWLGECSGFFYKEVKNKNGDIELVVVPTGDTYLVEVKEDFYCAKSGNVAVEYECRGKPSGIEATKATHWLYKIHTTAEDYIWVLMPTALLKGAIINKAFSRVVVGGDYGSKTKMYLFSLENFKRIGIVFTNNSNTHTKVETE